MAFGRLERSAQREPMSDINMTPLIDVMLVLLVIFILTAPLMTSSIKLDLPQTEAALPDEAEGEVVAIAITADGALHWGEAAVSLPDLKAHLARVARRDPTQEVQLRADKGVPYGKVAEVIGLLQQAGLARVAFVAESTEGDVAQAKAGVASGR